MSVRLSPADRPIDALAARVVSTGIHWTPKKKILQRHWDAPPPMTQAPRGGTDLTGFKFGRLTVIGYFAEVGGLWVVRCACGAYETRRTKAARNPNNCNDACDGCRHLLHLQDRDWSTRRDKESAGRFGG